ncbi:MAG: DUF222 domain-containing protein, partial [Gemmatimonadota bacterium]
MGYAVGHVAFALLETARAVYGSGADVEASGSADPSAEGPASPDRRAWDRAEVEELDGIEDEVATMAGHLHAGMRHFLGLIARYDRKRGWTRAGHRTCAHWLSFLTGFDLGTCREYVRVARALETLPETGAAMGRGALSFSQVRALTRVAKPETESDLLPLAEGATVAQLERMVRAWKTDRRLDDAERERIRHESRTLSVYPDGDGMYDVRGKLGAAGAAVLMRGIEVASDALYRERNPVPVPPEESAKRAGQRRADALVLLAERGLAAGFGAEDPRTLSGSRAERYQVVLHVEPETLAEEGEPGVSELEDGTRVSAETSRRLSCDCGVVRVTRGPDGDVLDVGRKTRTIPPALRRALEVRDRGCRFPGCGLRFTDGHHVVHWADGGETSLANTVLLCAHHHRLVHEGGWSLEWCGKDRQLAFR